MADRRQKGEDKQGLGLAILQFSYIRCLAETTFHEVKVTVLSVLSNLTKKAQNYKNSNKISFFVNKEESGMLTAVEVAIQSSQILGKKKKRI